MSLDLIPQPSRMPQPHEKRSDPARSCPHCRQGGVDIGKYITIAIKWDAENGYWHCVVCGFIGFGSDFDLIERPIVALISRAPRLPGEPKKKKLKVRL